MENLEKNISVTQLGNWKIHSHTQAIPMNSFEITQLENTACLWQDSFHKAHNNWLRTNYNAPSIIIRFDYVLDNEGKVRVYEIEDRPAGLGVMGIVNPQALESFVSSLRACALQSDKKIGVCISPGRLESTDDRFWADQLEDIRLVENGIPDESEEYLWIVRSLREEADYYSLASRSLSTIQFEGDKSYGLGMGMWEAITTELPWHKPFVVKPTVGCRCQNVHLFHPNKPSGGYSTRKKIEQAVADGAVSYIQPYYAPESPDFLPKGYALMRRCCLSYDLQTATYKVIGGLWEARPKCHKIHGAADALCGPLVL